MCKELTGKGFFIMLALVFFGNIIIPKILFYALISTAKIFLCATSHTGFIPLPSLTHTLSTREYVHVCVCVCEHNCSAPKAAWKTSWESHPCNLIQEAGLHQFVQLTFNWAFAAENFLKIFITIWVQEAVAFSRPARILITAISPFPFFSP